MDYEGNAIMRDEATEVARSPIQTANCDLMESIDRLAETVAKLDERLHSVLVFPDPNPGTGRLDSVGTLRSEQTAFTLTQVDRIRDVTERVERMIANNEL